MLKIRTEYHKNGKMFAPVKKVIQQVKRLQEIPVFVDDNTFSHRELFYALQQEGIEACFGVEITLDPKHDKRNMWVMGTSLKDLYNWHSEFLQTKDKINLLKETNPLEHGIIRFAGCLPSLEGITGRMEHTFFDYLDVNPMNQARYKRKSLETGKRHVTTTNNLFCSMGDIPDYEAIFGTSPATPAWILSEQELRKALWMLSDEEFLSGQELGKSIVDMCLVDEMPKIEPMKFQDEERQLKQNISVAKEDDPLFKEPEYANRLERELNVIIEKGFCTYFLVVQDLVQYAKQKGILVGCARGSVAGSLLAFTLGITEIDPIKHDLLFERFLDPSRQDPPDIDLDFPDNRRDEIFQYLADKYGQDKVARIGNVIRSGGRSLINKICGSLTMEQKKELGDKVTFGYSSLGDVLQEFAEGKPNYKNFERKAAYEHHVSHFGVHAGGVVVGNSSLSDFASIDAGRVLQADKEDCEKMGMLKIDVLGLRTLSVLQEIKEEAGIQDLNVFAIPLYDEKTLDVFREKRFAGIFQFEGKALQKIANKLDRFDFEVLVNLTAVARPAPLQAGADKKLFKEVEGLFLNKPYQKYLRKTNGVILYQEQVMQICSEIGGLTAKDIYKIRKGKSTEEELKEMQGRFVQNALSRCKSARKKQMEDLFHDLAESGYCMNKSHVVSYTVISFACAYLKAHYPDHFYAVSLRYAKDDTQKKELLLEAKKAGFSVNHFSKEKSSEKWICDGKELVGDFKNLKGCGEKTSQKMQAKKEESGFVNTKSTETKTAELFSLKDEFKSVFEDPYSVGCKRGSVFTFLCDLEEDDKKDVLVLARVKEVNKKEECLDFRVEDDTIPKTILCRLKKGFQDVSLHENDVILIRGNFGAKYYMIFADRIKMLKKDGEV